MQVEPYQSCLDCGDRLEKTTVYQRHAYCQDCNGIAVH